MNLVEQLILNTEHLTWNIEQGILTKEQGTYKIIQGTFLNIGQGKEYISKQKGRVSISVVGTESVRKNCSVFSPKEEL